MSAQQAKGERQAKMQQELLTMMQKQNAAILQILKKMADKWLHNPQSSLSHVVQVMN